MAQVLSIKYIQFTQKRVCLRVIYTSSNHSAYVICHLLAVDVTAIQHMFMSVNVSFKTIHFLEYEIRMLYNIVKRCREYGIIMVRIMVMD